MGKIKKNLFGKLIKCINRATGNPYGSSDWRTEYLDRPGLIVIGESETSHPGKSFIYIFPHTDSFEQPYMHTSCGGLSMSNDGCEIITDSSIYEYAFGDFGLDESAKEELLINYIR